MNPLLSNEQRARTIMIIFWILAGIQVVSFVSDVLQLQLLQQFSAGNIDNDAAVNNDMRQRLVAISYLIVLIVSIVFFIMWFRRAYCNLERTGRVNLKFSEGWSAGAWFIPFLNLVRPYEIMKEIWHKTQDATYGLMQHKSGALVGWWWAIYIGSNVLSNVAFRVRIQAHTIESFISSTYFDMLTTAIDIGSILVTIYMIREASDIESKLYHSYSLALEETEDKLGDIII